MMKNLQNTLTKFAKRGSLLMIGFLAGMFTLQAQILNPVKWSFDVQQDGDETTLIVKADIEAGWHVYSQHLPSDDGPIATSFMFTASGDYELVGKVDELSKVHTEYDPNFEMELNYFEDEAIFHQKIKRKNNGSFKVEGEFEFMVCDAEKCLPPEYVSMEFTVPPVQVETPEDPENPEDPTDTVGTTNDSVDGVEEPAGTPAVANYEIVDSVIEPPYVTEYDPNFLMDVNYFKESMEFRQNIKVINAKDSLVEGDLYFMTCNDEKCLPPKTIEFVFDLKTGKGYDKIDFRPGMELGSVIPSLPNVDLDNPDSDCSKKLDTLDAGPKIENPVRWTFASEKKSDGSFDLILKAEIDKGWHLYSQHLPSQDGPIATEFRFNTAEFEPDVEEVKEKKEAEPEPVNLWWTFLLGLGGGLFALLTPCVFPMIPLTVSFFTKGDSERGKGLGKAALYGFFIFLIYVALSIPFHFGSDPELLNEISTGVTLNLIFFAVFVAFAISFFGYFEITMPSKFSNRVDSASNLGGFVGIFFMALTLAIVSFSCTGPILGSVLGASLKNGPWPITAAMGGFGIALGLPFALFAAFPAMMKKLPQSGGWLNTVKVVIGFIELALAVKFLSNADLVKQWGLIPREVFFGLWILIGAGLTAYMMGWIKFPHDSPNRKWGWGRITFATMALAFTVYLIPGVMKNPWWNHNLLSGFPPPHFYSVYHDENPEFTDFDEAMAFAQERDLPLFIDFTGWACVNCRKMEDNVWPIPEIDSLIHQEYVLVSLYVDDKVDLPEEMQGTFEYVVNGEKQKKRIKTIGNKWATFQTHTFENNSQPYYVLLSPDGYLLNDPVGYTPDVDEYKAFLECGLDANRARQASK